MDHKIIIAEQNFNSVLMLKDGNFFLGKSIGSKKNTIGELCFNTSMTGYQEIITDPSYADQIITFTAPHIGNTGINFDDVESAAFFANGIVVRNDITLDSNYRSIGNLENWLIENNVTGICNIDTRSLTQNIRENSAQPAIIFSVNPGEELNLTNIYKLIKDQSDLEGKELLTKVSKEDSYENFSKSSEYNVVVIDCGIKRNILECLSNRKINYKILPVSTDIEKIKSYKPDGIFISNGPGDPEAALNIVKKYILEIIKLEIPLFGICMGHQLIALAAGLQTTKMLQGHRGANHPIKNLLTSKVEITCQNHGFCVKDQDIPKNILVTHRSLFDDTIAGIKFTNSPVFSVQYHPESSPGPHDSRYLFDEFIKLMQNNHA